MSRALVIARFALLWVAPLAAQGATGEFQFPTYPLAPAAVALGGAGVAWSHDATAGLNPATLVNAPRLSMHHFEGYADYGGNLAAASVGLFGRYAVGVSLRRFGWDRVIEDELGVPTGGLNTGDTEYTVTLAAAPTGFLRVGVAGSRLITTNLGVPTSATSWSAGAVVRYARAGHIGVALLHAGAPAIAPNGGTRYSLPTRVLAGIALTAKRLTIMADGELPPHAVNAWTAHAGVQWRAPAHLILRCGVESLASPNTVDRQTRWSTGLGLFLGRLEFGLTTRFGGVAGGQEWFVGLDALRPRVTPS